MGFITPRTSPYTITLLLILPALLALSYLIPLPAFSGPCVVVSPPLSTPLSSSEPEFRLLIGILTLPGRYARRHLLRHVYSLQQPSTSSSNSVAHVDVRFVFCNVSDEVDATLVALEAMRYGDVVILACNEGMNAGKTYTYFASLPDMLAGATDSAGTRRRPYDYVMKSDDDTYFRLDRLVTSLRGQPREDLYYGAGLPFGNPKSPFFMLGMGYILSWDLVEWIATSDIPRRNAVGPEDVLTGRWFNTGNKARNRYNTAPYMYDYKGPSSGDFLVDTIAVHQLKESTRWAHTLKYFNVTKGLKPSKFYHFS